MAISIHALREEGDEFGVYAWDPDRISIHALREEGDSLRPGILPSSTAFLSTPSARRATGQIFQATSTVDISIHALREEGDFLRYARTVRRSDFYPRPPRGGRL